MQRAFDVRVTGGFAVAPVVDGKDVVASLGQPRYVEDVAADVLGVAVQVVNRALGGLVGEGRELPAVEGFAVCSVEVDILVVQVEAIRGDVGGFVRVEEHAAAAGLQQCGDGQQGDDGRPGVQK